MMMTVSLLALVVVVAGLVWLVVHAVREERRTTLNTFEQAVVVAVLGLGDNAYGVTLHRALAQLLHKDVNFGTLYTTLERLEGLGYLASSHGEPVRERGWRPRHYYTVTGAGRAALAEKEKKGER